MIKRDLFERLLPALTK